MSGFANSIIGGAQILIRKAIRSRNYAPGSAGWTVNADGFSEFSNLTIRGKLIIQSTDQGVFVYKGAPAAGNLIVALAPAAGTDPFGNAFTQGIFLSGYLSGNTTNAIVLQPLNVTVTGVPTTFNPAQIFTRTLADGECETWITSPFDTGKGQNAATILMHGSDSSNAGGCDITLDAFTTTVIGDLIVNNGQLRATNPVTLFGETWHAVAYGAGWSAGASPVQGASYRLTPSNNVEFKGAALNAAAAAGQTMFTLPVGYRPPVTRSMLSYCRSVAAGAGFSINTNGVVTIDVVPTNGHTFEFDGCSFSLDS